jgi:hypothetical protein
MPLVPKSFTTGAAGGARMLGVRGRAGPLALSQCDVLQVFAYEARRVAKRLIRIAAECERAAQQQLLALEIDDLQFAPLHERAHLVNTAIDEQACAGAPRRRNERVGAKVAAEQVGCPHWRRTT